MTHSLHEIIATAHERLAERRDLAATAMADRIGHRETVQQLDAFLVNACRHTSAVCDTVLPAARRHLPDGRARVQAYVAQCRRTERALVRAKQRMYGEARVAATVWSVVWTEAVDELATLHRLEADLARDLDARSDGPVATVAARIALATELSPTRPHPNSPHTGTLGHVLRGLWARADRFWDAAEGRITHDRPVAAETTEDVAA